MKNILIVAGTRPEAIKMAPVYFALRDIARFQVRFCSTGQHREMLTQVLDFFGIQPDYSLDVMLANQSSYEVTSRLLLGMRGVMEAALPDLVVVQGDTTTTLVAALSAYYARTMVAHVEAGLRSFDRYAPYPEELNRVLTSHLAQLHFAPTEQARSNLLREGLPDNQIFVVGNTVIDALMWARDRIADCAGHADFERELESVDFSKRIVLVTGHRRESFGDPFRRICRALIRLSEEPGVEVVYPVHLNPRIRVPVSAALANQANIRLLPPVSYPAMVALIERSYLVLTDSGGIQEEAPSLRKPVLVMRDVTERPEGVQCGVAKLVGTAEEGIVQETQYLLRDRAAYDAMASGRNPYGDGQAALKVAQIVDAALRG
jgi:UDP-N-acetylglucosamine 2-epimerase (non-hydrolysing)